MAFFRAFGRFCWDVTRSSKGQNICNLPMRVNVNGLRSVLEIISYRRKFIDNMAGNGGKTAKLPTMQGTAIVFTIAHKKIAKKLFMGLTEARVDRHEQHQCHKITLSNIARI